MKSKCLNWKPKKTLIGINIIISVDKLACIKYFVKVLDLKKKDSAGFLISPENTL